MTFAAYITWRFDWEPNQTRQIVANTRYSCILWRSITRLAVSHSSQINFSMYTHETVCVCVCLCQRLLFNFDVDSCFSLVKTQRIHSGGKLTIVQFSASVRSRWFTAQSQQFAMVLFIYSPSDWYNWWFWHRIEFYPDQYFKLLTIYPHKHTHHAATDSTPFFFIIHLIWWNFTFIIRNGLLLTISQLK